MERPPELCELIAALNSDMERFDAAYIKARDEGDWAGQVHGFVGVLSLLMLSLKRLPGFNADMSILGELTLKLEALSVGNNALPPPERKAKGGRPPEGQEAAIMQGRAAGCVEILIRAGMFEKDASELIAKQLRTFRVVGRQGKPITASAVRDWRSKVSDRTAFCEKPDARDYYQALLEYWNELASDMPLQDIKKIVTKLCAPIGARKPSLYSS